MILDTSAWIEFFKATPIAEKVKSALATEACYTSMVTIAELTNWATREKRDAEIAIQKVEKLSTIVPLYQRVAVLAGKLNSERKKASKNWGMTDSLILATGALYGLRILTKDSGFSDLSSAQML